MNYRERIYKTFKREKIDRVVWQPRLEQWYKSRKADNSLPEHYRNMEEITNLIDDEKNSMTE